MEVSADRGLLLTYPWLLVPDVLSGAGLLLLQAVLQGVPGRQPALPVCSKALVMRVGICLLPSSMLKLILAFVSIRS